MSLATVSAPDWLTLHNGTLTASRDGKSWLVHLAGELVYVLALVPVEGQHGIKLMQTVNGLRIPVEGVHPNAETALAAGLSQLRATLGW